MSAGFPKELSRPLTAMQKALTTLQKSVEALTGTPHHELLAKVGGAAAVGFSVGVVSGEALSGSV